MGSASYGYDALNRLQSASTTGTDCTVVVNNLTKNWGESFNVDAWGNLLGITPTKCSAENLQVSVTPASGPSKNQIITAGYAYDAAGNMTLDGHGNAPVYDGESRIKSVAGVNYTYDGDGRRVMKDSGKLYWTGMGSDPLTETDLSGNPTADYVFFDGKRIARVDLPSGAVHYYFSDNLGSASVVTSATGTIEQESDYYPYGGERVLTSGPNNYKFTGKERDGESGLDYFVARHYSSAIGRFMVPDWAAKPTSVPYADFGDPQSLNLYGYVRNDPISRADADGHDASSFYGPGLSVTQMAQNAAQNDNGPQPKKATDLPKADTEKQKAQKKESSSKGTGFWSRLGQHLGNLFSGHSWNYGMRESVTHRILPAEPNRYVTAATDVAGVVAAVKDVKGLGYASAVISVANDHSPLNIGMTAASLAPGAIGFAATFIGAEADLLNFVVQTVGEGMIEAIPGKTMDDGNGHQVPNPAEMDPCEALGACH